MYLLASSQSVAAAARPGPPPPCVVSAAGHTYRALGKAIEAAAIGETVKVQGICDGTDTIAKNLTIQGSGPAPTLNGSKEGAVLTISAGKTVRLNRTHDRRRQGPVEAGS